MPDARTKRAAKDLEVDRRRVEVGRLRLQGYSIREIVVKLEELKEPITATRDNVHRDLQALSREWRANAAKATATHKGRILAGLDELRRNAYEAGDLNVVARTFHEEAAVTGANAPQKVAPTTPDGTESFKAVPLSDVVTGIVSIIEKGLARDEAAE